MADDFLAAAGLMPVTLADRPALTPFFDAVAEPLSDYTFSQVFTWRNSLRLAWKIVRGHLCVFANGSGDLTLLLPPLGDGNADAALAEARELMDAYNVAHGVPDRTRVEYASDAMLARLDRAKFDVVPMGGDYVYDVARMVDLAGGDLKSKRQERNRFQRNYVHRVESYDSARHLNDCLRLLHAWRDRQDVTHASDATGTMAAIKRQKETLATELALCHANELGLRGMVVYVADESGSESVKGFTLGETLGTDQSSIVIEKTDLETKGLAQFIFSEFCRVHWSHRPLVNAGDDWGLESLAWTKNSYRPVKMLQKYVLRPKAVAQVSTGFDPAPVSPQERSSACDDERDRKTERAELRSGGETRETPVPVTVRLARPTDLAATASLESNCFDAYNLSRRRLQYLSTRPSAVVLIAEMQGKVVGEAVGLLRRHKRGWTGRAYSLAVDPTARGKGVGRRLMTEMLARLAGRGARRVYLEVEQTNRSAIALYEKLGFKPIGTLDDYYGPGRTGVHMVCEIGAVPRLPRPVAA